MESLFVNFARSKLDLPEFISFIAFHLMTPTALAIQFEILSGIRRKPHTRDETMQENASTTESRAEDRAYDGSVDESVDACIEVKYLHKTRARYNLYDLAPYMKYISMRNLDSITRDEFVQFQSTGKSRKFKKYRDEEFEALLQNQLNGFKVSKKNFAAALDHV